MSYCTCPQVPREQQERLLEQFLTSETRIDWELLKLQKLYESQQPMEVSDFKKLLEETLPFRGSPCNRSLKCCSVCTRQCTTRCIQDCLNRVWMWRKQLEYQDNPTLALIVQSVDATNDPEAISWIVGDVLNAQKNSKLKEYMQNANLRPEENPYKLDYSPQYETEISPRTGKAHKKKAPGTGKYLIRPWPESGLCPYCLPQATHARRYRATDAKAGSGTGSGATSASRFEHA